MLHYLRVGLRITITQSHTHTMQQTHMHKAVTQRVEAKKLLSRRRQSEYSCVQWSHPLLVNTRKFKGGISRGSHLAITYGGDLLYLWMFLLLSPPSNFVQRILPFSRGLKSRTHLGYCRVKTHSDEWFLK